MYGKMTNIGAAADYRRDDFYFKRTSSGGHLERSAPIRPLLSFGGLAELLGEMIERAIASVRDRRHA